MCTWTLERQDWDTGEWLPAGEWADERAEENARYSAATEEIWGGAYRLYRDGVLIRFRTHIGGDN